MNTAGVPIPKFNFLTVSAGYRHIENYSRSARCFVVAKNSYNFEVDPNRSAASNYKPVVVKKDSIIEVLPS